MSIFSGGLVPPGSVVRLFENGPVLRDLNQLAQDAAKLAATPVWPLSDTELTDLLRAAHRLQQTTAALPARLVEHAVARGLPAAQGHKSTARWLRTLLILDPQPARELAEAAAAVHRPAIEQAVLDGHTDLRQATVIAATLDAIPTDLAHHHDATADEATRIIADAEHTMIQMAARLPAHQLRHVGERILTHLAPHLADQIDEAALARQETRAHPRRGLTLSLPVNGLIRLSGALTAEDAAIVHAALHPLCHPRPGDDRSPAQHRADALTEVCRLALRTQQLPDDGGEPPQLTVTVVYQPLTNTLSTLDTLDTLGTLDTGTLDTSTLDTGTLDTGTLDTGTLGTGTLGTGTTDTGQRLSASTVRRLACDARILPVVLGGTSQVLDAGRARRLATGPLRRALHIRDHGCAFPDCDRPPRWTDAHHITAWTAGGTTNLDNLVLLCRHHHRTIHDPAAGWTVRLGPDQLPEFLPPHWADPTQRPRRNLYHNRQ